MGDMPGAELATTKPQAEQKKCLLPSKAKKGSLLRAIEDIQRMPPEVMCQEFDRLMQNSQHHFRQEALIPCTGVATKLQNCLKSHQQESYKCFNIMEEYRQCVVLATQDHVDHMATKYVAAEGESEATVDADADADADTEEDQRRKQQHQPPSHAFTMVPPQSIPAPAMSGESERRRLWYKPWSWLN